MLIVDTDVVRVERQLRAGELTCPSCGAALAPWGHGRPREVRGDLGEGIAAFVDEKSIVDESYTRVAITETHATE